MKSGSGFMFCPKCVKKNSYIETVVVREGRDEIVLVCPICRTKYVLKEVGKFEGRL